MEEKNFWLLLSKLTAEGLKIELKIEESGKRGNKRKKKAK